MHDAITSPRQGPATGSPATGQKGSGHHLAPMVRIEACGGLGYASGSLGPADGPAWTTALYFSAETFTSLGYGDVVPTGPLRALPGFEALNGLLLIGWTASYTYVAMQHFWRDRGDRPPN